MNRLCITEVLLYSNSLYLTHNKTILYLSWVFLLPPPPSPQFFFLSTDHEMQNKWTYLTIYFYSTIMPFLRLNLGSLWISRKKISLSWLVVCHRLFVGIPLGSCKERCYKNWAKVLASDWPCVITLLSSRILCLNMFDSGLSLYFAFQLKKIY